MGKVKLETIIGGIFVGGVFVTSCALSKMGDPDSSLYTDLFRVSMFSIIAATNAYAIDRTYAIIKGIKRNKPQNNSEVYNN